MTDFSPVVKNTVHKIIKKRKRKKYVTCNCRNTKCINLYCECFKLGYCKKSCKCQNCKNSVKFEKERMIKIEEIKKRNPLAFCNSKDAKKNKAHNLKKGNTCNCKKSRCQKKYCDCFSKGMRCGKGCNC